MAIKLAGLKSAKPTEIKIDNQSSVDLPKGAEENIRHIFAFLPTEHQRGLERIRLVDFINNPQLKNSPVPIKGDLPGLYHQVNELTKIVPDSDEQPNRCDD